MFRLYLTFRLRSCLRMLKEIGLLRSMILILITALGIITLIKAEIRWILPIIAILLLGVYHNNRKDKVFLRSQIKSPTRFYQKEYLSLSTPFITTELIKGEWIAVGMLFLYSLFLPYLKEVKITSTPIRLPFLFRGGMDYIRMFRQSWWIYLLLLFSSIMGGSYGNIRIAKVNLIIWCFVQASAYFTIPEPLQLLHFKDYRTFNRMLSKTNSGNILVTSLPFITAILAFTPDTESVYYTLSTCIACFLYLQGLGLLRQVCKSELSLFLLHLPLLLPIFLLSCFIPYLLLLFSAVIGIISYVISGKLKSLWN